MGMLIRVARVLALLLLAVVLVSLVIAFASPTTGFAEKVVLLALIVGVVAAAVKIPSLARAVDARLQHPG
jgi:uncharacterized protein YhhL (DUF1145 family)